MMKINMGYPKKAQEVQIVKNMIDGVKVSQVEKIVNVDELNQLKEQSQQVLMSDKLIEYAAECVDRTREDERVQLGASPRALLLWIRAAKAYAFVEGREYVTPDDLKSLAPYVLAHRLTLVQHSSKEKNKEVDIIKEVLRKVKVPVGK